MPSGDRHTNTCITRSLAHAHSHAHTRSIHVYSDTATDNAHTLAHTTSDPSRTHRRHSPCSRLHDDARCLRLAHTHTHDHDFRLFFCRCCVVHMATVFKCIIYCVVRDYRVLVATTLSTTRHYLLPIYFAFHSARWGAISLTHSWKIRTHTRTCGLVRKKGAPTR